MIPQTSQRLIISTLLLILLFSFLLPQSAIGIETQVLRIENVYTTKSSINPSEGDTIELHFHLSMPGKVTVTIYDSMNREVATLLEDSVLQSGNHQISWNGDDKNNNPLPKNYYVYTLKAQTADGQTVLYDPTDITGGKQIGIQNIKYDRTENCVHFSLKKAAILNLRVGLTQGGPMMNTLIDWMPFPEGTHVINWDGHDKSGSVDLKNIKKLDINGPAYTLPMNAIILTGEPSLQRPLFLVETDMSGEVRIKKTDSNRRVMMNHWQHPRDKCYDPDIFLRLPKDQEYASNSVPIIDGPIKFSLDVNDSDKLFMLDQRFEIVLYVDFLFSHEEELGYLPYYWTWDPHGINEGVHYITAMLRGYEGHFGTTTTKVLVRKQNNEQ